MAGTSPEPVGKPLRCPVLRAGTCVRMGRVHRVYWDYWAELGLPERAPATSEADAGVRSKAETTTRRASEQTKGPVGLYASQQTRRRHARDPKVPVATPATCPGGGGFRPRRRRRLRARERAAKRGKGRWLTVRAQGGPLGDRERRGWPESEEFAGDPKRGRRRRSRRAGLPGSNRPSKRKRQRPPHLPDTSAGLGDAGGREHDEGAAAAAYGREGGNACGEGERRESDGEDQRGERRLGGLIPLSSPALPRWRAAAATGRREQAGAGEGGEELGRFGPGVSAR